MRQVFYTLERSWDATLPVLAYCGLNLSVAGEVDEDPTSRKFRGFAERLGYGGYVTCNLFAWISTSPSGLKSSGYLRGPDNDGHIMRAFSDRDVICAWGSNAVKLSRSREVLWSCIVVMRAHWR